MLKFASKSGRSAILALALSALAVPALADDGDGWFWGKGKMGHWFQGEMMDHGMREGWGPGMMGSKFTDGRLEDLKAQLAITASQQKAWDDYAAATKAAAASMRESHRTMMDAAPPATLPERLAMREGMMAHHAESMKTTSTALLALYNALDAGQKKTADDLIMGMGMM